MNTLTYKAFSDELIQIKLAQLEKEALWGELAPYGKKLVSSIRGIITKPGTLRQSGTIGTSPTLLQGTRIAGPRGAERYVGRTAAPTINYLPPYPGGLPARPGGLPKHLYPPKGATAPEALEQNMAELQKRVTARRASTPPMKRTPESQLPLGKRRLDIMKLDPATRSHIRLLRLRARAGLPAPMMA